MRTMAMRLCDVRRVCSSNMSVASISQEKPSFFLLLLPTMASFGSLPQEEVFLPESFQDSYVHDYLRELIDFEKQWRHLINIHIVDFITHNQWELLDPAWRTALLPNDADNDDRWLSSLVDLAVHYKCPVSHSE